MKFAAMALMFALISCGGDDTGKPYGAQCSQASECASGECGSPNGGKFCGCASDSDCSDGDVCRLTLDTGHQCVGAPDAGVGSN